ncbi:toprim domain-containing protein [Marinobacterium stanieri]|uniref:Toprim-like n=1 Tax=Marinobacterium stanieri TaxID=49186 RepID=A0A1N6Q438_9GAMM|nr:toprim domain-containing protein [Marinobacterium stanieri]SIQ11348.1 Toprim-like [Marinobacterium stanieri]
MNPQLRDDIIARLTQQLKGKAVKQYISKIECPSCNQREAFTNVDAPWMVKCGRENRCGAQHHVKDLFPELFETWTERYAPKDEAAQKANPTAVADGYLRDGRGFDLMKIRGWYTQEYYHDHKINQGTTTVRFALPNGHWERLLDKPQRFGKQKARIIGNYKGTAWVPPILTAKELAEAKEIWITEGIFDAIALMHEGITAISNLSSANYIDVTLEEIRKAVPQGGKLPTLVWAQDGDRAGRKATLKHRDRAEASGWECEAAQIPLMDGRRHDWNDLLQRERLGAKDLDRYRYYGDLLLARTAAEKALLIYNHNAQNDRGKREFWFEFGGKLWWWKLDLEAFDREMREQEADGPEQMSEQQRETALKAAGMLSCVCSAVPTPLYFQRNSVTDESWYYFRIEMPDESVHKHAFTPKQLTSASEFKNRLLGIKNAWWIGSGKQLDRIMQDQMIGLRTVETIDYIGYSKDHGVYVFTDVAIKDGKVVPINDEDFYQFGKLSLKTLAGSPEIQLNTDTSEYNPHWASQVAQGFGSIGVVTTAWWLGALFAEQIRRKHKSFPFFELVGEAGAGKSTLIEFLWKTCGRIDEEGFDPGKLSLPARSRKFAQVSNLPVVLIEADRDSDKAKAKQFDWDEMKPLFNGRAIRSIGLKTTGNETKEQPFRGSIMISQNAQVEASEAILSRICHITLTREHQNAQTRVAAEWLESIPMANVSGFLLQATRAEQHLMEIFDKAAKHYEKYLYQLDEIRMIRIAQCHGQLIALVDCLGEKGLGLLPEPIIAEARKFVVEMAKERQAALNADHPMVTEFWEAFDYIEGTGDSITSKLNHFGTGSNQIAVNLKQFERWCGEFKLRTPEMRTLKQLLRTSKSRKFLDSNRSVSSKILEGGKTVKCWVFDKG